MGEEIPTKDEGIVQRWLQNAGRQDGPSDGRQARKSGSGIVSVMSQPKPWPQL